VESCGTENVHSLTIQPVTLDINIAHGLLGHPDICTVKAMAAKENWTLTGTVKPCGSCALAKARAKAVPKTTLTKAKAPENGFLDILGPFMTRSTKTNTGYALWMTTLGTDGIVFCQRRVTFMYLCKLR
jgi:hypothetical protein